MKMRKIIKSLLKINLQDQKVAMAIILLSFLFAISIIASYRDQFTNNLVFSKSSNELLLEQLAQQVLDKCSAVRFTPSCYDEEIPKLMNRISMEDAFKVTRLIQQKDPKYIYCHVLAHKLSFQETTKYPDQWKDIITRCPTTTCNNGCPHGVLLKKFNADSLTDEQIEKLKLDLENICEPRVSWNPVRVEISMCYHALGHLHMYITKANIGKSLELCKFVGTKKDGRDFVYTCTQGVFMQIFQPLEPEDYALVKGLTPAKEEILNFCLHYTDKEFNACWTESWPLFREELYSPAGSIKFCSNLRDPESMRICYAGLMSFITTDFIMANSDYERLKNYCVEMPSKSECFDHAARRLLQIDPSLVDRALEVCRIAGTVGVGWECYRAMASYSRQSFHIRTEKLINYCNNLSSEWRQVCIEGEDNSPLPPKT